MVANHISAEIHRRMDSLIKDLKEYNRQVERAKKSGQMPKLSVMSEKEAWKKLAALSDRKEEVRAKIAVSRPWHAKSLEPSAEHAAELAGIDAEISALEPFLPKL